MEDNQNAGGSGDFMSKFLPGLVLGLVIGLGVGAFGLPFVTDRSPAITGNPDASAGTATGATSAGEREYRDFPEELEVDDPFGDLTPEQVEEAINDWKAQHADEIGEGESSESPASPD